jgi:5-methylcytosine-specific restriction endonuclease McrA
MAAVVRCARNVTEREKKTVASSQRWCCNVCADLLNHTYEIDHVVPLYGGGTNERANLQALCCNCHSLKTSKDLDVYGTPLAAVRQQGAKIPVHAVAATQGSSYTGGGGGGA